MSNQLIKETAQGREQVFPKNYIQNLKDKDSGANLEDIIKSFNMLFLPYLGNKFNTRKQVPMSFRHGGLWITYIIDNTVVTEWYDSTAVDDATWGSDTYWREGSNMLVGDISISKQGTWVINGEDTGISPKGDKGDSPIIRIYNNKIQVSYDEGNTYTDLNNTPVFTQFRFNSNTNTHQVSYDLGQTWQDVLPDKVYYKFKYNESTNTYQVSTDLGKTWYNVSAEKVFYKFRFNPTTNTHQVSTDLGSNWIDISTEKVFYKFRTNENKLQVSTDLGTTWEDCSDQIAAWFRWVSGDAADSVGKIQISRDEQKTWQDLSPNIVNNLRIKSYVATVGELPTNTADLGDIYMVGPTYDESDTNHDYPHYRMWVKQSSGWVDNGEYQSFQAGVVQELGDKPNVVISQKVVTENFNKKVDGEYSDNPEFIKVTTDSDNRLLNAITFDGTNYFPKTNINELSLEDEIIDNDAVKSQTYIDNPEFINVEKDADGRILSATRTDGSHYIHNVESETIPTEFSNIEDIEDRIEIKQDVDSRILSYRDADGKLHENAGIETPIVDTKNINAEKIDVGIINLSEVGLTEFEKALRANGFKGGQGDWSEATSLQIPEPRCAMINITSADGKPYSWPTSKFINNKVWVEFYDMNGNYFKKRAIHNAQGDTSMDFIKKNGAFDFCNDEWIGEDTFSIKFGDWVYQDSFHAKAYYTDFFKGVSIVAYKFADQVEKSRGIFNDRPWKKALLAKYTLGTDATNSSQINDLTLQLNNEAKCHPDGFPCIIYLDGNFYGIYSFNLKKHRDNYHMTKNIPEHIHIDGWFDKNTLWNGSIDWSSFEVRNPKNLYYKEEHNGTYEYDADVAQAEIAGDEEVNAWIEAGELPNGTKITSKIKTRLQTTAKVKNYITSLSQAIPKIKAATTTEEKKSIFERHFDVDNLVDYEIVQMALGDGDSTAKNWQWTTYDGVKWWVNEYDKDGAFGADFSGIFIYSPPSHGVWMGNDINIPTGQVINLYKSEIVNRWIFLRENGIISYENILNIINSWLDRIGTYYFEKEYEKWKESPCNRNDYVDKIHWKRTNIRITDGGAGLPLYDNDTTYNVGDECYYGKAGSSWKFKFVCILTTQGNPPLTQFYDTYPTLLGHRDSIWRLANWINKRLQAENELINGLI